MNIRKAVTVIISVTAFLIFSAYLAYVLVWNGVVLLNNPSKKAYPVRGVDVSSYQGQIDWETLSEQNIKFAFIKATEGSSFVDKRFAYNFEQAQKTHLAVGAYHFFSFQSAGKTQAENFIKTVKPFEGMLPPVVDFEFFGDATLPDKASVEKELCDMLNILEDYYGIKPIIYATEGAYDMYLSGKYENYDIWIRNVKTRPKMSDGRKWKFWQYTNREKLRGYNGDEKFIDMNVFSGTVEDFENYPRYR